ncbi:MAG: 2,4'-dihydroxyacetophenone dioxygenase family protein [Acidimicrobiales bacterium]
MAIAFETAPSAIHRGEADLPWVPDGFGGEMKLLVAKEREGLWIVRNRFAPGTLVQTHKHTGQVFGYTLAGAWHYLESEYVNRAGSFLFEPAGSIHTLNVPADNTEITDVWFQIYGSNLNLAPDGSVASVTDAASVLSRYRHQCAKVGVLDPPVLTD